MDNDFMRDFFRLPHEAKVRRESIAAAMMASFVSQMQWHFRSRADGEQITEEFAKELARDSVLLTDALLKELSK